jgi:hypothetical protein
MIWRRAYVVLAHRIRVSQINTAKQEETIQAIYTQNKGLVGHVKITAVRWATRVLRAGKTRAPLYICVAEPSQANLLIDQGLVWDYQLHNCEPFSDNCQVTQCFNCYQYGYTAHMCSNIAKCGFCAAPGHITNNCPVKTDPAKY